MPRPTLRIGNGLLGRESRCPVLARRDGRIDVLTLEDLARCPWRSSVISGRKTRAKGYVADFPDLLDRLGPILTDQPELKIVTNAGGLNPVACVRRCAAVLDRGGPGGGVLGAVTGDDVLADIRAGSARGSPCPPGDGRRR